MEATAFQFYAIEFTYYKTRLVKLVWSWAFWLNPQTGQIASSSALPEDDVVKVVIQIYVL